MVFNAYMEKPKKRLTNLQSRPKFGAMTHDLTNEWYVDIEASGQRKRYLRALKAEQKAY